MTESLPPFNIGLEQSLLGALLLNLDAMDIVADIVSADDLFEPVHREMFKRLAVARQDGRRLDLRLFIASLGEGGRTDAGGMPLSQYVARVTAEASSVLNAPDYARGIRDLADRRRALEGLEIAAAGLRNPNADIRALAEGAIADLDGLVTARSPAMLAAVSIGKAATQALEAAEAARANGGKITGVTSGLIELDDKLSGFQPGEFIVLAGRPGMGKTALGVSLARRAAGVGHRVLYWSGEMLGPALAQRVLTDLAFDRGATICYTALRSGNLSDADLAQLHAAEQRLRDLPLRIEQQPSLTVSQIGARARRMQQRGGLDLLLVDHMQKVKPRDRYRGNPVMEMGEISGSLAALAKELGVPVIGLCQLSRKNEERGDRRPELSDLRWSGDIEQDADVVLFVYREAYYLQRQRPPEECEKRDRHFARLTDTQNQLSVIVAKQRQGPIGTIDVFCHIGVNAIRDAARVA